MQLLDVLLGKCCVVSGCWQKSGELTVNGLEVSQENT